MAQALAQTAGVVRCQRLHGVADGQHQPLIQTAGTQVDAPPVVALPDPVLDGVFHQGLQGQWRQPGLGAGGLHVDRQHQLVAQPLLLDGHAAADQVQFLVQPHALALAQAQREPEELRQVDGHAARGRRVLRDE